MRLPIFKDKRFTEKCWSHVLPHLLELAGLQATLAADADLQHFWAAYGRVNEVIDGLAEPLMIGPLEIKVVAPGSPVGKALRELQKGPSAPPLIRLGSGRLGDRSIDAAFVYPRVPAAVG